MAKKAKAKRARKKSTMGRTMGRPAAGAPVTPTYLSSDQTYTMDLHSVVKALKVIEKHGRMAKFVRAAKQEKAGATFDAKTVNFVKDFMVKYKMHNDPIGKHIVNAKQAGRRALMAAGTGQFNCNFG
jgi:hypothetical protein